MEHLTEPTLFAFLFQSIALIFFIAASYFSYRWVREPVRRNRVKQALTQLGLIQTEDSEDEKIVNEYELRDYVWPVFLACLFTFIVYAIAHPYTIQLGLWAGVLEEVADVFGVDNIFPRAIVTGRILFWGFIGAYTYAIVLIYRRFMSYDLIPSIYIFVSTRFWLAMTVGAMVGVVVGTVSKSTGIPFDVNIVTVSAILFVIGFFPEHGLTWLIATAQTALKQRWSPAKELKLAEIEGLNIWQQARLKQEGIENVQNLATTNVADLVVATPFTVNQIIDWIDQAILTVYGGQEQLEALEKAGVRTASDVLANTSNGRHLNELAEATDLQKSELRVLRRSLQSALNIALVTRFRWQSSLDTARIKKAQDITLLQPKSIVKDKLV